MSSLNTALELRSTEIRELRQKNSKLELEAEIIPVLQNEKKKLELRVEDLQQIIENRKNTEKLVLYFFASSGRSRCTVNVLNCLLRHVFMSNKSRFRIIVIIGC